MTANSGEGETNLKKESSSFVKMRGKFLPGEGWSNLLKEQSKVLKNRVRL